jgi:hypothetical protein
LQRHIEAPQRTDQRLRLARRTHLLHDTPSPVDYADRGSSSDTSSPA